MNSGPAIKNDETPTTLAKAIPPRKFRLSRLALKELRETLRDRRTIVTLLLMPLLVYPTLSLVFKTFLFSNLGILAGDQPTVLQIAYAGDVEPQQLQAVLQQLSAAVEQVKKDRESEPNAAAGRNDPSDGALADSPTKSASKPLPGRAIQPPSFVNFGNHDWIPVDPASGHSVDELVELGGADVGVVFSLAQRKAWEVGSAELIARADATSQAAARYVKSQLELVNELELQMRLRRARMPTGPTIQLTTTTVGPEDAAPQAFPLASLVPLILVLMTITGAVYPAIDLTAGERERGTLETLMAAPIPRVGILVSKFIAVLTVAVFTAVLNLIGMFATVWVFQLDKQFGDGAFTWTVMLQILLLLILFAAFFSALLLAVTSFAKSFKEAQVYLIPIILLSLGPGLIAMSPGMKLDGLNTITPMINILLLARDVIQSNVAFVPAAVAVISTLIYAYLAIRLAARIFGSDSILYSSGGSFGEMFLRPGQRQVVVPLMAAIFCLVLLYPVNFASIGFIGRMAGESAGDLEVRFLTMGLFTAIAFVGIPSLVAFHQNAIMSSAFGLLRTRSVFWLVAIVLGVSLWPIVMGLTEGWHEVYGWIFGESEQEAWREQLVASTEEQVARVRQASWWVLALSLSILPAVCEEWFFRGMLLRSLLKSGSAFRAILISAVVFGSFHMLSNSVIAVDRFIPTTLVGLLLGYVAYKSNSVLPGMLLHSLHNGFVVFLAYSQESLTKLSWFPGEDDPVPRVWILIAAVLVVGAIGVLFTTQREAEPASP